MFNNVGLVKILNIRVYHICVFLDHIMDFLLFRGGFHSFYFFRSHYFSWVIIMEEIIFLSLHFIFLFQVICYFLFFGCHLCSIQDVAQILCDLKERSAFFSHILHLLKFILCLHFIDLCHIYFILFWHMIWANKSQLIE